MDSLHAMKLKLNEFWNHFGGSKTLGFGYSKQQKLELLKQYASLSFRFKDRQPISERRERFDATKAGRHQMKSHGYCFGCGAPASCRHHIIQIQNGGTNAKRNVVSLCDPCHEEIHPWLRKYLAETKTTI